MKPFAALLITFLGLGMAHAQTAPAGLTFQGRLTTLAGQPVPNGTAKVRVRIFDAPTGGTRLWTSGEGAGQELTVPVRNGVFATVLSQGFNSSNNPLTIGPTVFQGGVIYVEVAPLNQTPIVPRTQIWSAPWAFWAESAITVKDGAIVTSKLAAGAVTSSKLADGAVTNQVLALDPLSLSKVSGGTMGVNGPWVGIGTTTPNFRLDIQGGEPDLSIYMNNTSGGHAYRLISSGAGSGYGAGLFRIHDSNQSVDRLNISPSGNVAIGNFVAQDHLQVGVAHGANPPLSLRVYEDAQNWKGGAAFGYDQATVIMGQLNGVATIGGHNGQLSAWSDLALNPFAGNVGIGTATPTDRLHVAGGVRINGGIGADGVIGAAGYQMLGKFAMSGDTNQLILNQLFQFQDVVIDTPNTAGQGGFSVTDATPWKAGGSGGWAGSSDRRLKTDIKPIANPLDQFLSLKGVHYRWSDSVNAKAAPGDHYGFIAQDVQQVFPGWVSQNAQGYLGMSIPADWNALAVESVRELKKQNDLLRAKVRDLEAKQARFDDLARRLARLEQTLRK